MSQPVKRTTENQRKLTEDIWQEVPRAYSLNKNAGGNAKTCISPIANRPEVLTAQTKAARAHKNLQKLNKNTPKRVYKTHSHNKNAVLTAVKMDLSSLKAQTKAARVRDFVRMFNTKAIYYQVNNVIALFSPPEGFDMNNTSKFCSLPRQWNDIPSLPMDRCFLILRSRILMKSSESCETDTFFKELDDRLRSMNVATVEYQELQKKSHKQSQQDVSLETYKDYKVAVAKKKSIFFAGGKQTFIPVSPLDGEDYVLPDVRTFNHHPTDSFANNVEDSTTTHWQQQRFVPRDRALNVEVLTDSVQNVEEPYREVIPF